MCAFDVGAIPTHAACAQTRSEISLKCAARVRSHARAHQVKIEGRESNGAPIYKHATSDLVLAKSKTLQTEDSDEGEGWVVARWTTFGTKKEQRCMQIVQSGGMPLDTKRDAKWVEWSGRRWEEAPSVRLKPTWHGYGLSSREQSVHNPYSASDEVRRVGISAAKRGGRGRSNSPPKLRNGEAP